MKTKLRPRIGLLPTGLNMYFHQYPNLKDMGMAMYGKLLAHLEEYADVVSPGLVDTYDTAAKAAELNIVVIDSIKMETPKTAEFAKFLKAVGADCKCLVVTAAVDQNVVKSGRNIPGCEVTFANLLNVYDIVNANKLVVDKAALAKIEEVFA